MRKPLIAGNWKMNATLQEGEGLVKGILELIAGEQRGEGVEVVVAPPFTVLNHVKNLIASTTVKLSAQDLFFEQSGAYTGQISPIMLKDVGCDYVIIGHSERRLYFNETDETVNKKVHAALAVGLKPIVCVGESLDERDEGTTLEKVRSQCEGALRSIAPGAIERITMAYEPIWAIGTGRTATPEQAEEVHSALRALLSELFGPQAADGVRIIYGGSVKPENIDAIMAKPNIDGALVGGASLKAKDFARIVNFKRA